MAYPPLLDYESPSEYRTHYENIYCRGPILTFDGIAVRFRKGNFNHCFFESTKRDRRKDAFSKKRAERMDWIKAALQDPNSERYQGWDKKRKRYVKTRRVTVVMGNYVVVIAMTKPKEADFVTAYVADTSGPAAHPSTIDKIRSSPKWA